MTLTEVNGKATVPYYRTVKGQEIVLTYDQYDLTEVLDGQKFMGTLSFYEPLPTYHICDKDGVVSSINTEIKFGDITARQGWSAESLLAIVSNDLRTRLGHAVKNNTRTLELSAASEKVQEALMALDALTIRVQDETEHGTPTDI